MDLKTVHIPNILFLNGCFLTECDNIEDLFEAKLLSEIENKQDTIIEYDTIPDIFYSLETWIKKTNLKCWNCDCCFDNIPIFIPISVGKTDTISDISTHGNFCSFACAVRYLHFTNLNNKWDIYFMIHKLYFLFYKKEIINIEHAPSKYNMKQYGGNMDTVDYIKLVKSLNI